MKFDAYQMVTDRICGLLESGIKPWVKPWSGHKTWAWSGATGGYYSLLNQMLLADPDKKYKTMSELLADVSGEWVTFKQAADRGGNVKKGEKGRKIVFFKMLDKPTGKVDDEGNEIIERFPCLSVYTVFHIRQCEGLAQKYHTINEAPLDFKEDATAEEVAHGYLDREGITYNMVEGDRAYYSPALDLIVTPLPKQFISEAEYYAALFHEIIHSTGHESRLNRLTKDAAFGNASYSTEELVAEIGSASIMATLGIDTDSSLVNSAAYVKGWLKALRNDKKMIVTAASRVEKAVRMVLDIKDE